MSPQLADFAAAGMRYKKSPGQERIGQPITKYSKRPNKGLIFLPAGLVLPLHPSSAGPSAGQVATLSRAERNIRADQRSGNEESSLHCPDGRREGQEVFGGQADNPGVPPGLDADMWHMEVKSRGFLEKEGTCLKT